MNLIKPYLPSVLSSSELKKITGKEIIAEKYHDYLHDESRIPASSVDTVYFPKNTLEVSAAVRECFLNDKRFIISGGRTGIVGGAVAKDVDAVISVQYLNNIIRADNSSIRVESGISIDDVNRYVNDNFPALFYPVDPTETSASIGGTIATNASGARTYYYGPTRNWINALTIVIPDGSILEMRRGEIIADCRVFSISMSDETEKKFEFPYFDYPKTKITAGYQFTQDMDAMDLFIGCEGTLGIVTEAELRLIEKPSNRLYTMIWTSSENQAILVAKLIHESVKINPLAIEYFDPNTIKLLKTRRANEGAGSSVPKIDDTAQAAIFIDLPYKNESDLVTLSENLEEILNKVGLTLEQTWSGMEDSDLEKMKALRHAVPETVNMVVSERKKSYPDIYKLSTDLAVPDGQLENMLNIYHTKLEEEQLEYVMWGHIGDNHVHMNMLPRDMNELTRAKVLYDYFAHEAVKAGGSIAGEHGIGRLKRHLMTVQYPSEIIESMRELKSIFDPKFLLNPGVLLPD